ncbi:MAG: putative toxin-antitoxin system toxin component, PIN family [Thermomicrobiales bacterium]|nr:putative toxin-antitoxin system toxin component, PIN family [Thermomicrobiales bacterium]
MLDANVLVSGVLALERSTTTLGRLMLALEALEFRLVISEMILSEVEKNVPRVLGSAVDGPNTLSDYLNFLRMVADVTEVTSVTPGIATHPEDDWILATAVLGEVEFLVTGDKQLLALNEYRGVKIITPRQFVEQYLS